MAIGLKAKIVNQYDTARFLVGAGAREVTVVQCVVETDEPTPRTFGPYEKVFDRDVSPILVDQWLDDKRRALEGRV